MTVKRIATIGAMSVMSLVCVNQFICSPVFANGPVDIKIVEVVSDGSGGYKPWEDITDAMPGVTYSAIPRVRNDGSTDVEVKMCLSESVTNADGRTINSQQRIFGIEINNDWTLIGESKDSIDPAKGNCYKYNSRLDVSAVTEPLFNEVTLSPELGNEYSGATFNLHLDAYAADEFPEDEPSNNTTNTPTVTSPDTGVAGFLESDYAKLAGGFAIVVVVVALALIARKRIQKKI